MSMKYSAVIFDLFGTLVVTFSATEYRTLLKEMAATVGAPADDFSRLWLETSDQRWSGSFRTINANVEHICQVLNLAPDPARVQQAVALRWPVVKRSIQPRDDAVATLSRLREAGCRIALISDCSAEVAEYWPCTPFAEFIDVPIFSCTAGVKKPDPRIYRLACQRLGVEPHECVYVGDGGSCELSGAARVGMHPVLIRVPEEADDAHRVNGEEWNGTRIVRLGDLVALVLNGAG